MPVCHKKRFIFFHIPRCAGTSIESHLNIHQADNLYGVVDKEGQEITLHHLTPTELQRLELIDRQKVKEYFKFTIIRDPFDRMVSDYAWQQAHDRYKLFGKMSFNEYLDFAERVIAENLYYQKRHFDHFRPMVSYCVSDDELLLDDILLLENLEQGIARIANKVGFTTLPKLNSSNPSINELKTMANIDRVYRIYSADKVFHDRVTSLEFDYA